MKQPRVRIDQLLVERALVPTREKAKALLMAGEIFVNDQRVDKAGTFVHPEAVIEIRGRGLPFASRGGFKLEKALETLALPTEGLVAADIGASTGGFTDCLLKRGVRKVYAIDVGKGQLDCRLANDDRVVVMDRTNARFLHPDLLAELVDLASLDLSFISLQLVLPAAASIVAPEGCLICLIKPQFEAGAENVSRGGVVRDARVHAGVIERALRTGHALGFSLLGLTYSPIKGPAGNIEFLAGFRKHGPESPAKSPSSTEDSSIPVFDNSILRGQELLDSAFYPQVKAVVEAAWKELNDKSADLP